VDRDSLNLMTRDELVAYARRTGVEHPLGMTRAELADEILRRTVTDVERRRRARGWFGVARDLVAGLVEQGLNLPDAAKLIRGDVTFKTTVQAPIATVSLAEIYAGQGHPERALRLVDQVLGSEPDHEAARGLRDRLRQQMDPQPPSPVATVVETAPTPSPAEAAGGEPPPADDTEPAHPPASVDAGEGDAPVAIVADTTPPPAPADSGPSEALAPNVAESAPPAVPTEGAEQPAGVDEPEGDAVFSISGLERSYYFYWELSRQTRDRLGRVSPAGHPALKIVFFAPSPAGARRSERMVAVRSASGAITLESPAPRAVARAALGWHSAGEFLPLLVATELATSGSASAVPPDRRAVARAAQARALVAYRMPAPG
jgi:hypothetical protein